MLSELDQCADGGTCTLAAQGDAGAPLGACVTSSCPSCSGTTVSDGGPAKGYDCYSDGVGSTCSCSYDTIPNQTPCDTSTFGPTTICCADPGYPTSGHCDCAAITCSIIDSTLCNCSLGNGGQRNTTCDQSYGTCCLDSAGTICECLGNGSCSTGTLESSCSAIGTFSCASTKVSVSTCR